MKAKDIKIGDILLMKVSGLVVPVRVDAIRPVTDWKGYLKHIYYCTNTKTGHECQARSAVKFRGRYIPREHLERREIDPVSYAIAISQDMHQE